MRRPPVVVVLLVTLAAAQAASAHEVRPGYLELRQTDADQYAVLWKVPAVGELRLSIHPRFPENCKLTGDVSRYRGADSYSERSSIGCPGGLNGRSIAIAGLVATMTDVLVRVERADGSTQVARLTPSAPVLLIEASPSRPEVVATYLKLGVEHILFGIDHLLFVLALLLLVKSGRRLIATVTAFTVAHSVTLALSTLGWVHVVQRPVEAVIALSIVFVAAEILHREQGRPGLTERWPWVVAFTFGLLHGFGFAGVLREIGLPQQAIVLALLFFNLGVEIGQLLFVASVLPVIAAAKGLLADSPAWTWRSAPYAIGAVASYWVIDRIAALWH